jgi:hypothetical protein
MQDIECNPQAALLTFLNLSGDPSLAPPASGTSQTDSPTLSALWKRNGTWGDWALYTASPLRAFEKVLGVQAPVGVWDPAGLAADGSTCELCAPPPPLHRRALPNQHCRG